MAACERVHFARVSKLNDGLLVDAAEDLRVEPLLELFHRDVQHETTVGRARKNQFVFGFKRDDIFDIYNNEL